MSREYRLQEARRTRYVTIEDGRRLPKVSIMRQGDGRNPTIMIADPTIKDAIGRWNEVVYELKSPNELVIRPAPDWSKKGKPNRLFPYEG